MEQLINYESLAAKKKLEQESRFYLDTLGEALGDNNNTNIAITGGYGAGKTTIIDSYFEENKKEAEKMMRVSIATFQPEETPKLTTDHNLLEQQILQQMFFQVNPNKIPNSRFTKISDLSFKYVFGVLLYVLFTVIFTILIVSNNWINTYYSSTETIMGFFYSNWLWFLLLSLIITLNGISIWLLLMFFRKLGVSKFGVASTNIEFNFKDGSTVFNHYLDEIIYLFKKTDFEYIIFEDLDRFQNVKIFERLRSLNTALNRSAQLTGKNIKFVYALKDDIFTGEDETESIYNRTKFFDFIIPAVKVMHSSTAESILLKKLNNLLPQENDQVSDNQKLSSSLVADVALFINDMRTLINICNEFEVFRWRLQKSSVTYDNLFAFVVYKNIYPKDYSDLLENKGLVFDVFNKKEEIVRTLENKINILKNKSTNGLGSIITDKNDVAMLFSKKRKLHNKVIMKDNIILVSTPSGSINYIQEGQKILNYFIKQGIDGEFSVHENGKPIGKYRNIEEFVTIDSVNYLELYRDFEDKNIQEEKEIESQINELKKKIKYVKTKSISRLLIEDSIDLHIDLSNKKLLSFLIRNNWLNESYEDYLTEFREGSISKKDNEFIQSIKSGYTRENLYLNLKNVRKVAEKIRVDDINSIAVLNKDLIIFLLENDTEINNGKMNKIIQILFSHLDQHLEEVLVLIEILKEVTSEKILVWEFLDASIQNGVDIWKVIEEAGASKEQKEDLAITLFESCNFEELERISTDNLRDFASNNLDVKKLTNLGNMFDVLEGLEVKFVSISSIEEKSILENIIQTNCYQINLLNLRKILSNREISVRLIMEDIRVYNYCSDSSNIELLITNVLIQQERYREEEDIFAEFIEQLVDIDINNSVIQSLLCHRSGVITKLNQIYSFKLIRILFDEKKFKLTWENIEYCSEVFKKNEIIFNIDALLSIEHSWIELIENSSERVQTDFKNEEKYSLFVNRILKLNEDNHSKIEEFIAQLEFPVMIEEVSEIDNKVLELLINHRILPWQSNIYSVIHSEQHKVAFVLDNIDGARDNLRELIEEGDLIWSLNLFKIIITFDELGTDLIGKYIRDNLLEIEYQEFKLMTDIYELDFDNLLISKLIEEPNKDDMLILYLTQQWKTDSANDVADTINDYPVPWSEELFEEFRKEDLELATNYLLNHIAKINDVKMNQELFNTLIAKSDSSKFIINLINKYRGTVEINRQISEKLYKFLLDETEIVLELLQQTTVIEAIDMLPLETSSEFLYKFLVYKRFNREEVFEFLSKLSEPFSSIRINGGQVKITTRHSNIEELMDYLKSRKLKVISTIKPNEQGYIVNNKRI